MWALKPHYYSAESFYNFPYIFGLLFGLGLFAAYLDKPEGFVAGKYEDLLSRTGMATAAELARTSGSTFGRRPSGAPGWTWCESGLSDSKLCAARRRSNLGGNGPDYPNWQDAIPRQTGRSGTGDDGKSAIQAVSFVS